MKPTQPILLALCILVVTAGGTRADAPAPATVIPGPVDIHGNWLNLGSWTDAKGASVTAFTLFYTAALADGVPGLLRFASSLQNTDWVWSHSNPHGASTQSDGMRLDASNRLTLYNTSGVAKITLDPNGKSHIEPQGDLLMGKFTAQPK